MTTPERPEPRRVKITGDLFHPHVPAGAVKITRPSRWGNPHPVGRPCKPCGGTVHDLGASLTLFRRHLDSNPDLVERARRELAGRDLACWCPPDRPCHADIWLELVNRPAPDPGAEIAAEINRRLAERLQAHRARIERQRADRAAKNARRTAGLAARHAAKLRAARTEGDQRT